MKVTQKTDKKRREAIPRHVGICKCAKRKTEDDTGYSTCSTVCPLRNPMARRRHAIHSRDWHTTYYSNRCTLYGPSCLGIMKSSRQ